MISSDGIAKNPTICGKKAGISPFINESSQISAVLQWFCTGVKEGMHTTFSDGRRRNHDP